ncbi:MAG: amino-acid N-acetyltransferase [Treponemataceae bacterium]|nr:amino-acid N-acetyltransferase [Treponemataceae bacterium]
MQQVSRGAKAQQIRDVVRYVRRFHGALVVMYLDDEIIGSPLFSSHIRDISLIHEAGLKVAVVPGARRRIDEVLASAGIPWRVEDGVRITGEDAMPQLKMAAFDVSNIVMTSLAANHVTAVIGNWVRARARGVIDGTDFGTAGEIERLQTEQLASVLASGVVPIFPCIGWSSAGKPYNISSVMLAERIAVNLHADKLFFIVMNGTVDGSAFVIPPGVGLSEENAVPAMNLEELAEFLKLNGSLEGRRNEKILSFLRAAGDACRNGVVRSHIVDGSLDGALPCEIFSGLGSGTMVYSSQYGALRPMTQQDVPAVLSVMRPFVGRKILLPRTDRQLLDRIEDFIVYEIDGGVRACAALHSYPDGQAEIAAVAVSESFSKLGIGPKMLEHLIQKARDAGRTSVFALTTQAADWFEQFGFRADDVATMPEQRKAFWEPGRGSKLFRLDLRDVPPGGFSAL